MPNLKIGDKVKIPPVGTKRPLGSRPDDMESSVAQAARSLNQDFMYITDITKMDVVVGEKPGYKTSNYYMEDLELYSNLRFKVGDKVKIPKKKTPYDSYNDLLEELKGYEKDYLIIKDYYKEFSHTKADYILQMDGNNAKFKCTLFLDSDLEPYEEKKMYNIEEILRENILVFLNTEEEWKKVKDLNKGKLTTRFYGAYCYSLNEESYSSTSSRHKHGSYNNDWLIIDFSQINFNKEMETKIPEKWYVKGGKKLCRDDLFDKITGGALAGNSESGFYYRRENGDWTYEYKPPIGRTEITIEQLKQIFNMSTRKIIGYKTPIDLFDGQVSKGTMFLRMNNPDNRYTIQAHWTNYIGADPYLLPKEIVETWEPVYEEEFKVGDWVTYIGGNGGINTDVWIPGKVTEQITRIDGDNLSVKWGSNVKGGFRKAIPEEIKNATVVKIGAYTAEKVASHYVKFGCKTFSKVWLESLKEILKIKDMEYNPVFTVNGQNITIELIDKLLKM